MKQGSEVREFLTLRAHVLCFFFSGKDKLELVLRLILLTGWFSSELRTAPYLGLTFEQSKKAALFK